MSPDPSGPDDGGAGTLVLVVGPSGSGKDTLIDYARRALPDERVVFCRRVVTRPSSRHEVHDEVSEEDYARAVAGGAFALHWRAHGLGYGLPAEIDDELAAGRVVVANVSRSIVAAARLRYRRVLIVLLDVGPDVLRYRLAARAREAGAAQESRLSAADAERPTGHDVVVIGNSGPIEVAGRAFLHLLSDALADQRAVTRPASQVREEVGPAGDSS